MGTQRVFIGLGSNLKQPIQQLRRALQALTALDVNARVSVSSFYKNPPMAGLQQPDYVNAVARIDTVLEPLSLLDQLQAIEAAQGRVRDGARWAARTLDLDLLLFGEKIIKQQRLIVPHPGLHERSFVLYPLHEIAPQLQIPGLGPLAELLARVSAEQLEKVTE